MKGENELSTSTDSFQQEKEQISNSKSLKHWQFYKDFFPKIKAKHDPVT